MFVVLILEEKEDYDSEESLITWTEVTEVRGPFSDQDRANQYIRNHLHPSLAINAQSWQVTNIDPPVIDPPVVELDPTWKAIDDVIDSFRLAGVDEKIITEVRDAVSNNLGD